MKDVDLSGIEIQGGLRDRRITADYVAEALREAIHRGELDDGTVLNQAAIAAHFGVSRVPVREAMRQLQAEGLIESQAHRIAMVRTLSFDRVLEMYDIRALLEGYATERAVPHVGPALLDELHVLEREMRSVADHARWLRLNAEFHGRLYGPSGAETTLELVDRLRTRAERHVRLLSRGGGVHRPEEAGREHEQILRLVGDGDAAGARDAVVAHIHHTRDRLAAQRVDAPRPERG
jgi:DNA-binding GntR family transcriptional regulator